MNNKEINKEFSRELNKRCKLVFGEEKWAEMCEDMIYTQKAVEAYQAAAYAEYEAKKEAEKEAAAKEAKEEQPVKKLKPLAKINKNKKLVYKKKEEEVAEEPVNKIRVATAADIAAMVKNEAPVTIGRKKPTLATSKELIEKEEEEEWLKAELAYYDKIEEDWLRMELEDHDRMCEELDMMEQMTEEELEAYKEKKFEEDMAKWDAEIAAEKKAAQERGYSFVGKLKDGKRVWEYKLEADNKTRFNLKEISIKKRKEEGKETAEDVMDRLDRDFIQMNKELDEFEKELKKAIATDVKEGAALTRKKPKLVSDVEKKAAVEVAREAAATSSKEVTHKVLLDTKEYSSKPKSLEAGAIQNRLPKCAVDITVEDLAVALVSGRTFKPNYMTGKSQDTFVSSSLIAIDIDNKGIELEKYGYISTENFLKKVKENKYKPCIVYTTFSSTYKCNKYRAIFQLDKVITNLNELRAIATEIKKEYPYADAKVSPVHIIYGGTELVLLNPNSIVETPNVEYIEEIKAAQPTKPTEIKQVVVEKKNINEEMLRNNLSVLKSKFAGTVIDITDSFNWINHNVPMTIAFGYDLNTRFRCILPGHTDNNPSARISEANDGQQNYICSCTQTYKSLIDTVAQLLNVNKVIAQNIIADAIGIKIGSTYQRNMRLLVADIIANTDKVIEKDSVIYKYMSRSNLHGLYNLIQQFASSHITEAPLGADDKITFFMSQSQIKEKMIQYQMKGADRIGYKLNALKELGLIRALRDEEINSEALAKAKAIQSKMTLDNPRSAKYMKRIEYYELCLITPSEIKKAEDILKKQKDLGVKRTNINSTRRALAHGAEFASSINVQMDVEAKLNNPKVQKELDKVVAAADKLLTEQQYFTEEMLRKEYDPSRKKRKDAAIKVINDALPLIMQQFKLKKERVKSSTKTLYSIPNNIKTNTTIYCLPM